MRSFHQKSSNTTKLVILIFCSIKEERQAICFYYLWERVLKEILSGFSSKSPACLSSFKNIHNIICSSTNTKRRSLKDRFPLWKLSLNVSTFAFFNGFYVIWAVALLIRADRCFFLLHFNQMMLLLALVRLSLLSRIMMDPILAFVTDVHVIVFLLDILLTFYVVDTSKHSFDARSWPKKDQTNRLEEANVLVRTVRTFGRELFRHGSQEFEPTKFTSQLFFNRSTNIFNGLRQ
jgi:ABC-type multidrug transport system fused ATPase/permease subunit